MMHRRFRWSSVEQSFDAVIDTGFNGALTLPPGWIDSLGLPQSGEESVSLADGRVIVVPMYVGYVILGETYEVDIAKAQTDPLVGTALLWGFSLYWIVTGHLFVPIDLKIPKLRHVISSVVEKYPSRSR